MGDTTTTMLAQGDLGALDRDNLCSAHCADDMLHYANGRAVASHLRFGDGTEFR